MDAVSGVEWVGVECLTEDSEENMWFGVADGAVRYDGVTWTHYGEKDGIGAVWEILGARNGSMYAGNRNGVSRFVNGKWEQVFPRTSSAPFVTAQVSGGARLGALSLMEAEDGSIWVRTTYGALRLLHGEVYCLDTSRIQWLSEVS